VTVSEALLERENMDGSEIKAMIFGAETGTDAATEEVTVPNKTVSPGEGPCVDNA